MRGADPSPRCQKVVPYAYLLGLAEVVTATASNADIVVVGGT